MKKSKPHIVTLDAGIFPCRVLFTVAVKHEEILARLKKNKSMDWYDCVASEGEFYKLPYWAGKRVYTNTKTGQERIYFLFHIGRPFDFSDWDMVMLAHECLHLCQFMLKDILDRDKEHEAEAYLHSHLMTECLKILRG